MTESKKHAKQSFWSLEILFHLISAFLTIKSPCLMLQAIHPCILWIVPYLHPSKHLLILTLPTLGESLDWPLALFLTSQPMHDSQQAHQKTHNFLIYEKTVIAKILKRCLLVVQKGPLQIINSHWIPIINSLCNKQLFFVSAQKWSITWSLS